MTTDGRKETPRAAGSGRQPDRETRLAAALRENLRKRKRQKSARKDAAAPPPRAGPQDDS